jgi:orotidine-5'-phosphate decarboxylase
MRPDNPTILALDYSDLSDARQMLSKVRPYIGMAKIGLELFTAYGKNSLELSQEFNVPIFLDLKLHDIPKTVGKTIEVICNLLSGFNQQHYLTVHCSGGKEMCKTALKVTEGSNIKIVGITALTSLNERDFRDLGYRDSRASTRTSDLLELGRDCNAKNDGINAFVCAPNQLPTMRKNYPLDIELISPGIRDDSQEDQDHKRFKPASFAFKNGATWIVVGRPITQAHDPVSAALHFQDQADKHRPL